MPIILEQSDSFRKSIDVVILATPTGVAISGDVRWFDDLYQIPSTVVPCVYSDDAAYRVALCRHASGPAIVLVEDDAVPAGYEQIVYLARWAFTANTDTCASVAISVPRKTLAPTLGEDGRPVPLPTPTVRQVSSTPVLPVVDAEKTRGRKRRRRIKVLTEEMRTLKQAGTNPEAMTAAQRARATELVMLVLDLPVHVP